MSRSPDGPVGLVLETAAEARLWSGVLSTQGLQALAFPDVAALESDGRLASCRALVADAPALLAAGIPPARFAASLRARLPRVACFIRLPHRTGISPGERAWARGAGIASLLPGSTVVEWRRSVEPVLARILEVLGLPPVQPEPLGAHLALLVRQGEEPRSGPLKDIYTDAYRLETDGVDAGAILDAMRGGLEVQDRAFRGRTYRQCFVASEAVDWVARAGGLDRSGSLRACAFLARTGRIHHVLREAAFADDFLFFRFAGSRGELEAVDLAELEQALRAPGGLVIEDRAYRARSYPRTFVGSEAVDWMMRRRSLSLGGAEALGQRLLELGVLHHVHDEHGFVDANYYYRFRDDEPGRGET